MKRRHFIEAGSLIAISSLAACGGSDRQPVPYQLLEGNVYGDWAQSTYVIRSDTEWAAAWAAHDSRMTPAPDRPQIDFASFTLLGLFLGWTGIGQFLSVVNVFGEGGKHVVEYQVRSLGGDGGTGIDAPLVLFLLTPSPVASAEFRKVT